MTHPFEPLRMLAAMRSNGVSYVLVGSFASAAHGAPITMDDVDVCIPQDQDNLRRAGLTLQQLGAEPIGSDSPSRSSYETTAGRIDVIELGDGFAGLYERAADMDLGNGVIARVASMGDLVEMKKTSGDLMGLVQMSAARTPSVSHADDVDEFGPADPREWPRWIARVWETFEGVDSFLTRKVFGESDKIRS